MFFRIASIAALMILCSCAYTMEKQIQDIHVETPGAENATCYLYIEKLKYKVTPPETVNVSKSPDDLIVDCYAPGNRHQKVFIKPALSKYIYGDAALAVAPIAWDAAAYSLYKYPDTITVDFTTTPVTPEALPAQNRPDVKQPEEYPLEEILPGTPRRNTADLPVEFKKREKPGLSSGPDGPYMIEEGGKTPDKGDLKSAAPPAAINPAGKPSATTAPEKAGPAFPGQ